jgi:hypothetical protein
VGLHSWQRCSRSLLRTLAPAYFPILNAHVLGLSVLHRINDALMAVFFLLAGLEIKRELLAELKAGLVSEWTKKALAAAIASSRNLGGGRGNLPAVAVKRWANKGPTNLPRGNDRHLGIEPANDL